LNAHELNQRICSAFTCLDGPPRAFFELPCIDRPPLESNPDDQVLRVVYTTIRVGMIGGADLVESVLCGWAWGRLHALVAKESIEDRSWILFWRTRPQLTEFVDAKGRMCTHLRMRLAIPGIDLSELASPEGDEVRML